MKLKWNQYIYKYRESWGLTQPSELILLSCDPAVVQHLYLLTPLDSHINTRLILQYRPPHSPHPLQLWFQFQATSICFIKCPWCLHSCLSHEHWCHFRASFAACARWEWRHDAGGVWWISSWPEWFHQGHQEGLQQWEESECDISIDIMSWNWNQHCHACKIRSHALHLTLLVAADDLLQSNTSACQHTLWLIEVGFKES